MSKKFHERLLRGSGLQSRPFHSKFGAALLKKFGWEEGQGLGKESNGRVECLQIRRREENVGLGHENASETKAQDQWRNWWDGLYNSMAAKLRANAAHRRVSQSTLSSESDDDGEDCTVKPLYGKKSVLSAGQQALKNLAHREPNDTAMGTGSHAENVERDNDLDIEQKSCARQKKDTDTSAFQQKTDPCFSFVDGAVSTAAVTPRSHASSPVSSDTPVSASFAAQSFVAEDTIPVLSKKEIKKKGFEIHTLNMARSVKDDLTHSVQARTCTHESQLGKKVRKKRNKNSLASADPEVEDDSGIQTCCESVKQNGCFLFSDNVEGFVSKAQPRLKPNGGTDGDVQLFSDNLIEVGVGLPVARDSCSNERQKIRKKSKRGRDLAVTGEESRKGKGDVSAEQEEEDAAEEVGLPVAADSCSNERQKIHKISKRGRDLAVTGEESRKGKGDVDAEQEEEDAAEEEKVGLPVAADSCSDERQRIRKKSKRGRDLAVTGEESRKGKGDVDAEQEEEDAAEEGKVGPPVAADSCSNERLKIRKKSKRGRDLAVTGEESRKGKGDVDAEQEEEDAARKKRKRKTEKGVSPGDDEGEEEGDAGVKQEKKKTKVSNAEEGAGTSEKIWKKKRKHHLSDA